MIIMTIMRIMITMKIIKEKYKKENAGAFFYTQKNKIDIFSRLVEVCGF